jgi:transposase
MTTKRKATKSRNRYSDVYKAETLSLAEKIGVSVAAKQLGLHDAQLYSWRSKTRLRQETCAAEDPLRIENARLKKQLAEQAEELAIIKKAAAFFAKSLK